MAREVAADRLRRRQRVQRRFTAVALPLFLLGFLLAVGCHQSWGRLLVLAGMVTSAAGLPAAALVHPKPLRE